ncbi:hypothetical protein F4604DRAFT_1683421 [Suillus subluteus]|nr:hypothetical protein F4604DRAFT_1683421 [Suillus subluteus]
MAVGKLRSMSFGSKTPASGNPSPTMPGGPSVKRITRSSNVTLTSLEIEAQPSTVTDAASAHITQISGATPLPVLTAIRSVVYLLKQHVIDEISEAAAQQITTTVAQQVMESITEKLVDHVIAAIAPQVA